MTHDIDTVLGWRGATVLDRDGDKIGSLKELYLDQDDRPSWGAVHTGLFGLRQTFVPLADARPVDDAIQLPYAKEHVKDAPAIEPDAQLSAEEEGRLYRHYELPSTGDEIAGEPRDGVVQAPADEAEERFGAEAPARDGGPAKGDEAGGMVRSEEELSVGTRRRVRGKARLRKYVVTEHVQRTIPVRREEVRVEYEPAEGGAGEGEAADDVSRRGGD
jgi:stress response protein YsnF